MATRILPAQRVLAQLLEYDPSTGVLTWKERTGYTAALCGMSPKRLRAWNHTFAGRKAFNQQTGRGYLSGSLLGKTFRTHRVIWKLVHGVDPIQVDHINGVRDDNRLANLRAVDFTENSRNAKRRVDNSSGITGVDRWKDYWRARIKVDGRDRHLGYFDRFEDAVSARAEAARKFNFHENHGR